ncbi:MAG: DUF499 domain-containing protein [candidate division KSB1 bacterium]|nr:DUF499 domain-containing protein [candidate division KSB1 bacterium]
MTAFHTIAIPHRDILEGRLTMDVFAADLWEVFKGRGVDEYKDARQFFRKTYLTEGLQNLLAIVAKRLQGKGGDPVIQIQTPFGGGKTHALIAMYHKASEWQAQKVVIVGTAMSPADTPWGMLEEQLTGKREAFKGLVSPGREALYRLLAQKQPVLVLMDEVLEYVTKAAGVAVGESTLAAQTMAFMQEFTEVVGTLEKVALVITLPSSILEHYDEQAEKLFGQLQKVAGRVEKIYTPVQEHEITKVIRQRLFSRIDHARADTIIKNFMDYALKESILPVGTEPSEYHNRFESSYPFLPEVIDVLYQRWGSFPNFQRTRGVLRLLSLVIHALKDRQAPYVSLADFDLRNQEIRQELLKHTGAEYNGVIAADITGEESGSRKIDAALGDAYKGLKLGARTTTTVFLYSFSGGTEKGVTLGEAKRVATTTQNPAAVVAEALEQLRGNLFFLQYQSGKYYFTNQPNLNRILLTKMENLGDAELEEFEQGLLKKNIAGGKLKVFPWPEFSPSGKVEIPDTPDLKLIILKACDHAFMKQTLETKGSTPRANRNTLFFLAPLESEKAGFHHLVKKVIAYRMIGEDMTIHLSDEQKKEIKADLKRIEEGLNEALRRYYRLLYIPAKDGFKEQDLGIPTYGEAKKLDDEVYEKLRSEGEILERIVPLIIKERYLKNNTFVQTEQLYQSGAKTPGEFRVVRREVWEKGIAEGVQQGLFGLGELEDGEPVCRFFNQSVPVALSSSEVIIREELCVPSEGKEEYARPYPTSDEIKGKVTTGIAELVSQQNLSPATSLSGKQKAVRQEIRLRFTLPKGKVSGIMGVMNLLQANFDRLKIELLAENGQITEQDYEDKIKEAFRQLGIELDE